jgi:1-deoxy-D-xylulose-5-phosphate synthase
LVAEDGTTHHGAFDFAYLRHVPNMVVMAPKDENELQHMMKTALLYDGPASVRYPRGTCLGVPMDQEPAVLEIGKGELLREGTDVAIAAIGVTVGQAVKAAERLAEEGLSVAVINGRFVKPLDGELIASVVGKTRCLVTVEEGARMGGFGAAVLESLAEQGITVPIKLIGLPDWYIEQGPQDLLREKYGLTAEGIYQTVKGFWEQLSAEGGKVWIPNARRETFSLSGESQYHPEGDEQGS